MPAKKVANKKTTKKEKDFAEKPISKEEQELALKDKELDMDQEQFEGKQQQKQQEQMLDAEITQQRIDVQKAIADDKLQLGLDRLEQQAELKLLELEQRFRRN